MLYKIFIHNSEKLSVPEHCRSSKSVYLNSDYFSSFINLQAASLQRAFYRFPPITHIRALSYLRYFLFCCYTRISTYVRSISWNKQVCSSMLTTLSERAINYAFIILLCVFRFMWALRVSIRYLTLTCHPSDTYISKRRCSSTYLFDFSSKSMKTTVSETSMCVSRGISTSPRLIQYVQ